jgi:hypothetical protein
MGEALLFTDLAEAYWLPFRSSVQSDTLPNAREMPKSFPMSSAFKMAILTFAKRLTAPPENPETR